MKVRHGIVNLEKLEIRIQFDINSVCKIQRVPKFNRHIVERECLGNGWYGSNKETTTISEENAYIVLHNDSPIGFIITKQNGVSYIMGKNSNNFIKNYCKNNY